MKTYSIEFVTQATGAQVLSRHQTSFEAVGTDTRNSLIDQLFVALKGDNFDAHLFLNQAVQRGAAALLVHTVNDDVKKIAEKVTVFQVPDTLLALQALAQADRRRLKAKVVGIAGSNGKTTSKEFCASLISAKKQVHASKGSFNNHWGVPMTLLACPEDAEVAIVEMGMNHKDELSLLAKIAEVDACVVTYVGIEHIEFFGSLEKIAEAEGEIYADSPASALRIYNLDNIYTLKMFEAAKKKYPATKLLTFSQQSALKADVSLYIQRMTLDFLEVSGAIKGINGKATVPVFGEHNVTNLMVAACAALTVGMSPAEIWQNLNRCKTNWGRNQIIKTHSGAQIIFDGYNANPDSMKALLSNLSKLEVAGAKIGVFAQMRELGEQSPKFHKELGELVGNAGFDRLWFIGPDAESFQQGIKRSGFSKNLFISNAYEESLATQMASVLKHGDLVFVKGSRGMKLEQFVQVCEPKDFTLNKT